MKIRFLKIGFVLLFLCSCSNSKLLLEEDIKGTSNSKQEHIRSSTATLNPPSSTTTPKPTKTIAPTSTNTPIPWESFIFSEIVRIGYVGKLWMPVPKEWEGIGFSNVEIIQISPTPDDLYFDNHGNKIAFWEINHQQPRDFSIEFKADLAPIKYSIDINDVKEYDKSSSIYQEYTKPSEWIQSEDEDILKKAQEIVGSENNPYLQAKLIHAWVVENIAWGDVANAKDTYIRGKAGCGGHSWLFIAMLRSLGIPARGIGGIHPLPGSEFTIGEFRWRDNEFGIHIWSEFYLEDIGWIQADAGDINGFANIQEHRVVLFRGEDIILGHDYPLGTIPWFHMPNIDILSDSTPRTQTIGYNDIILFVEY